MDLARDLLAQFGSLGGLLNAGQDQFCAARGLGQAKFVQLQAVLEMSRRHLGEHLRKGEALTSPEQTEHYLTAQLRHRLQEVFAALFLDNRHRLIRYEKLFFGTIDGASVHPREVVRKALAHNAAAIILAHNHPSGVAEPSAADHSITQRLREALALIDMRVLDHLIIGEGSAFSFAREGYL